MLALNKKEKQNNNNIIETTELKNHDQNLFIIDSEPLGHRSHKRKYVEHSKRIELDPNSWMVQSINGDKSKIPIELTFGIRQKNLDKLDAIVEQVSDPDHPHYGKHLTFKQIKELVQPHPESINAVTKWLRMNDVEPIVTDGQDFIRAKMNLTKAEELLYVSYDKITNQFSKLAFVRSLDPYTVPLEISEYIDFIGGVNHLPLISPTPKEAKKIPIGLDLGGFNSNGDPYMSPESIRKSMNVTLKTTKSSKTSQAIAQFLKEYFSESDLEKFQKRFGLASQKIDQILGPNNGSQPGVETALDIQYLMGMAPNATTWVVSTAGLHEGQEPFLDWLINLSSNPDLPLVHSISYGDDENTIEKAYTQRIDTELKKFAAMGKTIVFSSGDFGAGCTADCKSFSPGWPASSPYVLSVGGVIQRSNGNMQGDRISGGGFSNYFETPKYQLKEVKKYQKKHLNSTLSPFYNASGRGIPDVSSFSENVIISYKNNFIPIGGTSASTPIIAGLISLINDKRLLENKSPVGFVNPLFYKIAREHPKSFLDIDQGEDTKYKCCGHGFKAVKGWDAQTGLGVPNFDVLLKHCLKY
eukprot:gene2398-2965_t